MGKMKTFATQNHRSLTSMISLVGDRIANVSMVNYSGQVGKPLISRRIEIVEENTG